MFTNLNVDLGLVYEELSFLVHPIILSNPWMWITNKLFHELFLHNINSFSGSKDEWSQ